MSNVIAIQEVTITGPIKFKGSNAIRYNIDLNSVPFGQIWTFKEAGERHPFHAKTLTGKYDHFATYAAAETFIRGEM